MKKPLSKAKNKVQAKSGRYAKDSEPKPLYSSKKKNLENMKLLVSYPEVAKIIEETRAFLKIYEGGFGENQAEIDKWNDYDTKKSDEVMSDPKFFKKEMEIKKNWKEKRILPDDARRQLRELYNTVPVNYLGDQIRKIIREFNIPENYERNLRNYILLGKISAPLENFSIGPFQAGEFLRDVRRVPITVYAKLTDDDLHDLKLHVNRYFGRKRLPFIQDAKNIERDLEIEQMYSDRKRFDPLENEEYELSVGEIAENLFGSEKKKNKVYDAVSNVRKLRKRRFGKL